MLSLSLRALLLILCVGLCLTGCRREIVAPGDPVAAVKGLAQAVRDNDLVRYSQLSMPPPLHKRLEARWTQNLASAPEPSVAQQRDYSRWMGKLTTPDAEVRLFKSWDTRLKKLEGEIGSQWQLMQATGGIFLNGFIQANDSLSAEQKAHAKSASTVVLEWITPALIADRGKARKAIAALTETARKLDLPTLAHTRSLEMLPTLEKSGQALKGLKRAARAYGLDMDASLNDVRAQLVDADAQQATVRVSYPLLGETVEFDMRMIRRDGRWYSADAVRKAETELLQPASGSPDTAP